MRTDEARRAWARGAWLWVLCWALLGLAWGSLAHAEQGKAKPVSPPAKVVAKGKPTPEVKGKAVKKADAKKAEPAKKADARKADLKPAKKLEPVVVGKKVEPKPSKKASLRR